MIPFKLFYQVYLRYCIANITLIIPCYFLFEVIIIKYLDQFNKQISIIRNISMIMCVIVCYRLTLKEILFGKYEKIVVKTRFENIPWKFICYSFIIEIIVLILHNVIFINVLDIIPLWINRTIGIIINYFVMNFWLERYAKMEISTK